MDSLFILIPIAMIFVCIAVAIFFWAVKSGQFDNLNTEGKRILMGEPEKPKAARDTRVKSDSSSTSGPR